MTAHEPFSPRKLGERGVPLWRWALTGSLMGVLAALFVWAPASWLAASVREATSDRLQLLESRGTVWAGSARLQFSGGLGSRNRAELPGIVSWKIRPSWHGLNLQLSAACCTPAPLQGRWLTRAGLGTFEIVDGASQWPAALLTGLGSPWNTLQAEGALQLTTENLSLQWLRGEVSIVKGRVGLTALAISSRLSIIKPMGSYRMTLLGGNPVALELGTLEGPLQLNGRGLWSGSRLRFEGVASTDAEHEVALTNMLNIIGRRDGARSLISLD